MNLKSNYLMI